MALVAEKIADLPKAPPTLRRNARVPGSYLDCLTARAITNPMSRQRAAPTDPKVLSALSGMNKNGSEAVAVERQGLTQQRRQFADSEKRQDQEMLARNRQNREVVSLLTQIKRGIHLMSAGARGGLADSFLDLIGSRGPRGPRVGMTSRTRYRNRVTGRYEARPRTFMGRAAARFGIGETAVASTSVAGRMGRVGRIAGRVLGKVALPIAAGLALADGVNGMRNADTIMGRKTNNLEKVGVGVSEAVNGALLGLPDLISKKVFGVSFSRGIVSLVSDIGAKTMKAISDPMALVAQVYNGASSSITSWLSNVKGAVDALVDAIKGRRFGEIPGRFMEVVKLTTPAGAAVTAGESLGRALPAPVRQAVNQTVERVGTAAQVTAETVTSTTKEVTGKVTGSTRARYMEQRDSLSRNAKLFGINGGDLAAAAAQESSFNANAKAKTSSATGTFQFLDRTWVEEVGKVIRRGDVPSELKQFARDYDENGKYKLADRRGNINKSEPRTAALLALRKNGNVSNYLGAAFTSRNMKSLRDAGIKDTPGNTYLAHFLGIGGAKKLLSANPDANAAALMPKPAAANKSVFYTPTGRPKKVREIIEWAANKMATKRAEVDAYERGASTYKAQISVTTTTPSLPVATTTTTTTAKASAQTAPSANSPSATNTVTPTVAPASDVKVLSSITSPVTVTGAPSAKATPAVTVRAEPTPPPSIGAQRPAVQSPAVVLRTQPVQAATIMPPMPVVQPKPTPVATPPVSTSQTQTSQFNGKSAPASASATPAKQSSSGSLPSLDSIPTQPSLELLAIASLLHTV